MKKQATNFQIAKFHMVCVVAAKNRVIGDGNDLLWQLPATLRRVKQLTMGCPLIMGRRTFDSIGGHCQPFVCGNDATNAGGLMELSLLPA